MNTMNVTDNPMDDALRVVELPEEFEAVQFASDISNGPALARMLGERDSRLQYADQHWRLTWNDCTNGTVTERSTLLPGDWLVRSTRTRQWRVVPESLFARLYTQAG